VLSEAFKLFTKNISHTFVFSTVLQEQISDNDTGDCVDGRKVTDVFISYRRSNGSMLAR
jgi:hypothetical protein